MTVGPLECDTCYGALTVGGVLMHTPAWCLPDLSPLWSSFTLRGNNRLLPHRRGRKPYPRRIDETHLSFPLIVTGYADAAGTPFSEWGSGYSDAYIDIYEGEAPLTQSQGLEANIQILQEAFHLCDPTAVTDSVVTAEFALPSGTTRTSRVQVLGMVGQLWPGFIWQGTLELLDVDGNLMVCDPGA